MDLGAIGSLKAKYQAKVICKYINAMESNKKLPKITILDAMAILEQSRLHYQTKPSLIALKKLGFQKKVDRIQSRTLMIRLRNCQKC